MGMRETVSRWTGHLYPSIFKFSFALFDVPEAIAVSRTALCSAAALTRLQVRPPCWVSARQRTRACHSASHAQEPADALISSLARPAAHMRKPIAGNLGCRIVPIQSIRVCCLLSVSGRA